jgi:hypothetical protein
MKEWGDHNLGARTPELALETHLLQNGWSLDRDSRLTAYDPGPRIYRRDGQEVWIRFPWQRFMVSYNGDHELPSTPDELKLFDQGLWDKPFTGFKTKA